MALTLSVFGVAGGFPYLPACLFQFEAIGTPTLAAIFDECERTVNTVHEFAVRQQQKQGEHTLALTLTGYKFETVAPERFAPPAQ